MMYVTKLIQPPHTPLVVGEWQEEDGTVDVATPDGRQFRIPRFDIETPVLCCHLCGKPALAKVEKRTKRDYVECPDHARHMYESFFSMSHDVKRFNHKQRRDFTRQAIYWLRTWKRVFEARTDRKVSLDADPGTKS